MCASGSWQDFGESGAVNDRFSNADSQTDHDISSSLGIQLSSKRERDQSLSLSHIHTQAHTQTDRHTHTDRQTDTHTHTHTHTTSGPRGRSFLPYLHAEPARPISHTRIPSRLGEMDDSAGAEGPRLGVGGSWTGGGRGDAAGAGERVEEGGGLRRGWRGRNYEDMLRGVEGGVGGGRVESRQARREEAFGGKVKAGENRSREGAVGEEGVAGGG